MFIDYLTIIMINLVAGMAILAYYIFFGLDAKDQRPFAAAFGSVGLLGLIFGLAMIFTWPLPGSYNIGFGEATALFGAVFLAAAVALSQGWSLIPVTIFAFVAGVHAILVGVRIIDLQMTKEPLMSGIGFIMAGISAVLAGPMLRLLQKNRILRMLAVALIISTALFWAFTYYGALWGHLESFKSWTPITMR